MIERYIQITCDVCGEPSHSDDHMTIAEFKRLLVTAGWKHRASKSMCRDCCERKCKWSEATLYG